MTHTKPSWATLCWVDNHNIFIEIPVNNQPPFIAKYPRTPAGLAEALGRMVEYHAERAAPPIYTPPPRPTTTAVPSPYTSDTRAKAREVLARMGITS